MIQFNSSEAVLLLGVLIALGALTLWHARLISRGETSIEANINKAETKRLAERNKVPSLYCIHTQVVSDWLLVCQYLLVGSFCLRFA